MKSSHKIGILGALLSLLFCSSLADAGANAIRSAPNPQLLFSFDMCDAKQVTLSQTGTQFAVISDDHISLNDTPMFHNPGMHIVLWPNSGDVEFYAGDFQPSVKSVVRINDQGILGTTVFGSTFSLARENGSALTRDRELTSAPVWAKGLFVRWPSQLYLTTTDQILAGTPAFDPSQDNDVRFRSAREYTGLISRSVIGTNVFEIGSDSEGSLFWRKNYEGDVTPLPNLHRFFYSDLSFAKEGDGNLAIIGRGLYWPNPDRASQASSTLPLYANPIVELGTGIVNFYASPSRVTALRPNGRAKARRLQTEVTRWVKHGWYLHGMTTSSEAKKTILLFRNMNDKYASQSVFDSAIVLVDEDRNQTRRFVCQQQFTLDRVVADVPTDPLNPSDPSVKGPSFLPVPVNGETSLTPTAATVSMMTTIPKAQNESEFVEFTDRGHRIGLWITQSTPTPKGTVILVRGGPAETVFGRTIGQMENRVLGQGYRLLRVEYSGAGNTGYDIGVRLGQDRKQSLRRDAAAVRAFLQERRLNQGEPIAILAESFGSGLTAELLKLDDINVVKAILVSPAGTWTDPITNTVSKQSEIGRRGQALYDRMLMGAPKDKSGSEVGAWYQEIRERTCHDPRSLFIFGSNDTVVRASDWMPECINHPNFNVISGANHQLDSDPRALDVLSTALAQLPQK